MSRLAVLLMPVAALLILSAPIHASGDQCEDINVPMCLWSSTANLGYNRTRFPNLLEHTSQAEAGMEMHLFYPLVKVRCSPALQSFLCLVYVPECPADEAGDMTPPCRELCEEARVGCESLMNKFGFRWSENLECRKFPPAASGGCAVPEGSSIVVGTPAPIPSLPTASADNEECSCEAEEYPGASEIRDLRQSVERLIAQVNSLQEAVRFPTNCASDAEPTEHPAEAEGDDEDED